MNVSIHATDPQVAGADAAQPAWRGEPALAARSCSSTASRCTARSSCARGSTTATCSTTRWPACSTSIRAGQRGVGAARRSRSTTTRPAMRPHTRRRGQCRRRAGRGVSAALPRSCSAGGWSSPPTSTTSSPVDRSRGRGLRGVPDARGRHRHGPHASNASSPARRRASTGTQAGFFASVDGAPAAGYRAPATRPATPACAAARGRRPVTDRARVGLALSAQNAPARDPHRGVRRGGDRAARAPARPGGRRADHPGREPSSSAATPR